MKLEQVMERLEDLRIRCYIAEDFDSQDAISEAMDALYDYDLATEELIQMQQKFGTAAEPIQKRRKFYCPDCRQEIKYQNSFCHWCGKKLMWK